MSFRGFPLMMTIVFRKTLCIIIAAVLVLFTVGCKGMEEKYSEAADRDDECIAVSDEYTVHSTDVVQQNSSLQQKEMTISTESTYVTTDMVQTPAEFGTSGVADVAEKIDMGTAREDIKSRDCFDSDNVSEKRSSFMPDNDAETSDSVAEFVTDGGADSGINSNPFGIELPDVYF